MSNSVITAMTELAAGRPVLVLDDEDRENEGDIVFAAELATPALMAFLVRHTSGFVCVALPEESCDRLGLPPMCHTNGDPRGTAYRVTVDAVQAGTGISARDRARTVRLLADPGAGQAAFTRPGHVVPLAARPGGVLERPGHTEAAVDLTSLAGLRPAGVLCEVVSTRRPGQMAHRDELVDFAVAHGLATVTIADIIAYRRATEPQVERVAATRMPTSAGLFRTLGYRALGDGSEHLALVAGEVGGAFDVPVHLHPECLLGDAFGGRRCSCTHRLDAAMREITELGRGIVLYLRPADRGLPSCRSPVAGHLATDILRDLDVGSVRHLHNPAALRPALGLLTGVEAAGHVA